MSVLTIVTNGWDVMCFSMNLRDTLNITSVDLEFSRSLLLKRVQFKLSIACLEKFTLDRKASVSVAITTLRIFDFETAIGILDHEIHDIINYPDECFFFERTLVLHNQQWHMFGYDAHVSNCFCYRLKT